MVAVEAPEPVPGGAAASGREPSERDLAGAFLVIAATSDPAINASIAQLARSGGSLAMRADAPEDCDFHLPAVLRAGDLTVAFSTNGASPRFAVRLRDEAAGRYGVPHAEFCRIARDVRREARTSLEQPARAALLRRLADSELFDLIASGELDRARARAAQMLHEARALPSADLEGDDRPTGRHYACDRGGRVFLVGAGPGDPDLLTVKGARCLQSADTVLHDGTVAPELLSFCPVAAERIDVGKRKGHCAFSQEEIIAMLIERAQQGRTVVRLKGGDPLVFGRGGEEARALQRAGIPFEIVPGVSSVAAVPAYAGIPITDREYAASFGVYSAHQRGGLFYSDEQWRTIAHGPDTLVFLMGKSRCESVVTKLIAHGRSPSTPVALIFEGTTARQRTVVSTLGAVTAALDGTDTAGPCLIVVGDVVHARSQMSWFGTDFADRDRSWPDRNAAGGLACHDD